MKDKFVYCNTFSEFLKLYNVYRTDFANCKFFCDQDNDCLKNDLSYDKIERMIIDV